jgi:hypothetical protein
MQADAPFGVLGVIGNRRMPPSNKLFTYIRPLFGYDFV